MPEGEPVNRRQRTGSGGLLGHQQPGLGGGSAWSWPSGGTAVSLAGMGKVRGNTVDGASMGAVCWALQREDRASAGAAEPPAKPGVEQ